MTLPTKQSETPGDPAAVSLWLTKNAIRLGGTDPAAPLDDMEPLRELLAGARVVALGENSHYIREFALLRQRLLRFLVERCGFRALAFESGFSEGFALDEWIGGQGTDGKLSVLAESCIAAGLARPSEVRAMLQWLRDYNAHGGKLRFLGIDVPSAAGSVLPALRPVREYIARVDPAALGLVDGAVAIGAEVAGTTMAQAAPRYLTLATDRRDALTAALSRMADRMDALAPQFVDATSREDLDVARWRIEAARAADHQLRSVAAAYAGEALPAASTSRDRFMAASTDWWLDRLDPGTQVVVMAHNAHIQRTPVVYGGQTLTLPMGLHLARSLGDGYLAIGLTSSAGRTAAMVPAPDSDPYGFIVEDTELAPPVPGSIEADFETARVGLAAADLRAARNALAQGSRPGCVRLDSGYIETPVLDAFDVMIHVPRSTLSGDLWF